MASKFDLKVTDDLDDVSTVGDGSTVGEMTPQIAVGECFAVGANKKKLGDENIYEAFKKKLEGEGRPFECDVDEALKSKKFEPFKFSPCPYMHIGKNKTTNPHMRAFWFATLSFFLAFTGWFCLMPLNTIIRQDIGICDNQDALDAGIDDKCVCKGNCKAILGNAKMGNVGSTIVLRIFVGSMLEMFGPVNVQCILVSLGTLAVGLAAFINGPTMYIIIQTSLGVLGATFVTNQFWMPLNFAGNVIGIANATAGGWGNVGGGFANLIMPIVYRIVTSAGHEPGLAWRLTMLFPVICFCITVPCMKKFSQDTPLGPIDCERDLKKKSVSVWDYWTCAKDLRVIILFLHYAACFGTELCVTQEVVGYFVANFKLPLEQAGMLGFMFGAMNLFARSAGGIVSDRMSAKYGMRGRIWGHCLLLVGEAIFLFFYGCISYEIGWGVALVVLIIFSIFVQAAEGSTYGIVPFVMPKHLGIVSAIVGAGGNVGAVIGQAAFYKPDYGDDYLLPYKMHAGFVLFCALLSPLIHFKYSGSMFTGTVFSRLCNQGCFDVVIDWKKKTDYYEVIGSYIAPSNTSGGAYVSKSTTFKIPVDEEAIVLGRVGRLSAAVFIPNVQCLDKTAFLRRDLAVRNGVKSILMIPSNDGSTIFECASSKEMRLRPGFCAADLAKLVFTDPAKASECVEFVEPNQPAPKISTKPFDQVSRDSALESQLRGLMTDVLAGLSKLHANGLLHNDVKTAMFVGAHLQLTDISESGLNPEKVLGTEGYSAIAPEAYQGKVCTKSDVFSAGVLMYVLVTKKSPFPASTYVDSTYARVHANLAQALKAVEWSDVWSSMPAARAFCQKLMTLPVNDRPSADKALEDEWIRTASK